VERWTAPAQLTQRKDKLLLLHKQRGQLHFLRLRQKNDTPDIWIPILAFFIPVVGLILYLVWKDDKPQSSSAAGKFALIGFIVEVVIGILIFCSIIFLISMSTI